MSHSVDVEAEDGEHGFGRANRGGVRAVVVATGTGRLPETLAALAAQTYRDFGVTVVDASLDDGEQAKARHADIDAAVRQFHAGVIAAPRGAHFAKAANVMLSDTSLDSEWILFLHDEVALEPSTVETLVEGAESGGADIVAPKICDWGDPNVLREVGMGSDRFGFPYTSVEPGEVDHGQHDKDRTALYVTTAAMLIRTALFRQLGGFDPSLGSIEQDLDICWRARIMGANVAVIPAAVAYHAPGEFDRGQVPYPRIQAQTNRLRVMLKCYAFRSLPIVLFQLAMLNLLEIVLLTFSGRGRRARSLAGSWISALFHLGGIWSARRKVQRARSISDSEIRALQFSESARVRAYIENRLRAEGDEDVPVALQASGTGAWEFAIHEITRPQVLFWAVALVLFAVGARKFVFDPNVPLVGEAVPIPGTEALWRNYAASWHSFGFGSTASPSPASALLGPIQWIFPAWGTAKILVGCYFLGLLGAWRVASRLGKWPGPAVAVALYGLSPAMVGAMDRGSVGAVVFFGFAPFIFGRMLAHFTGRAGFSGSVRRVLGMAVIIAIPTAFFPAALPITVGMAALIFVMSLFSSRVVASMAAFVTTVLASAIAFGLLWPWSYTLVGPASPLANAWGGWEGARFQIGSAGVLRMHVAQAGGLPWGTVFAGLALLSLFVVKGERLSWALRCWGIALASMAPIWLAGQDLIDAALPIALGVLMPAAFSLALCAGMGASELAEKEADGSQRLAKVAAVIVLVASAVLLAASMWSFLNGRLGLGYNEFRRAVEAPTRAGESDSFKLLWIGAQQDLPGYPLSIPGAEGAGAYTLSGPAGPEWGDIEPHTPGAGSEHLGEVLAQIASVGSTRGGRSLATLGVRYVILPQASSESESGPAGTLPPPQALIDGFRRQLDMKEMQAAPGVVVFEVAPDSRLDNVSVVGPSVVEAARANGASQGASDDEPRTEELLLTAEFNEARPAIGAPIPNETGYVEADSGAGVIVSQEFNDSWTFTDGTGRTLLPTTHEPAFGWSNLFVFGSDYSGNARLEFRDDGSRRQELIIQLVAVVVLLLLAMLFRSREYDPDSARPDRMAAVG
ncbi:MAG: hypothetical protein DCC49_06205 [Acidobacteria bacterium]|nr:MAG: hypothetical protein DCC49_06205 [Acidobacteriota bacterium]